MAAEVLNFCDWMWSGLLSVAWPTIKITLLCKIVAKNLPLVEVSVSFLDFPGIFFQPLYSAWMAKDTKILIIWYIDGHQQWLPRKPFGSVTFAPTTKTLWHTLIKDFFQIIFYKKMSVLLSLFWLMQHSLISIFLDGFHFKFMVRSRIVDFAHCQF